MGVHLMLECPHEDVARVRRGLTTSAPIMLQQLVRRIQTAHARAGRPLQDEVAARRVSELRTLMEAADWSSADGKQEQEQEQERFKDTNTQLKWA